jgi:hypothetical protein
MILATRTHPRHLLGLAGRLPFEDDLWSRAPSSICSISGPPVTMYDLRTRHMTSLRWHAFGGLEFEVGPKISGLTESPAQPGISTDPRFWTNLEIKADECLPTKAPHMMRPWGIHGYQRPADSNHSPPQSSSGRQPAKLTKWCYELVWRGRR